MDKISHSQATITRSNHQLQSKQQLISTIKSKLFRQYSSSQNYFYTKELNQIVMEQTTMANIMFQEYQFLDEQQEYLRRIYLINEYKNKLIGINQYYYYHYDVPRIFQQNISDSYNNWHDKKKELLYKKVKNILNYSNENNKSYESKCSNEQGGQNRQKIGTILNEISEYNPQSKKYYIRKKQKEQKGKKKQKIKVDESIGVIQIHKKLENILSQCSFIQDISTIFDSNDSKKQVLQKPNKDQNLTLSSKYNFKKKSVTIQPIIVSKINSNVKQPPIQKKYFQTININFNVKKKVFSLQKIKKPQQTVKIQQINLQKSRLELPRYKSLSTVKIVIKKQNEYVSPLQVKKTYLIKNNSNKLPSFQINKKGLSKSDFSVRKLKSNQIVRKVKNEIPIDAMLKDQNQKTAKKSNILINKLSKIPIQQQQTIKKILFNRLSK